MTEQRAEIAPDEASDADGLSPVKDDNEVWHDFMPLRIKEFYQDLVLGQHRAVHCPTCRGKQTNQ